jgi:hypothetical protein
MIDAVFILLGALLAVGFVGYFGSDRLFTGPKTSSAYRRLAGLCVGGVVAGMLGLINLVCIHTSNHSSATGVIVDLRQYAGRHHSSNFKVRSEDGSLLQVHCDSDSKRLIPGETVRVDVLNYHSTLLQLTVLDGRYAGWTLHEGDGSSGSEIAIGYGFLTAFAAWLRRRYIAKKTDESILLPGG